MKLRFACGAEVSRLPRHHVSSFLNDRWLGVFVALCTKMVNRFTASFLYLKRVEECSGIIPFKLVAVLLSVPAFKISHFFFKITYLIQHRKLVPLCRSCAGQRGTDFSLHFGA